MKNKNIGNDFWESLMDKDGIDAVAEAKVRAIKELFSILPS